MNSYPYLSDAEKSKVAAFVADSVMLEAVRKVLLAGIYQNGVMAAGEPHDPAQNFALTQVFKSLNGSLPVTNEELGQNIRAQGAGIKLVECAFAELAKIGGPVKSPIQPDGNPAD